MAATIFFLNPAEAEVLPACCVSAGGETHGPDPRHSPHLLVPGEVRRPEERALEASAEAPVTRETPLVNAIGIPLNAERGVSEPERVAVEHARPLQFDADGRPLPDVMLPCCHLVQGETHSPDPRDERAPVLLTAEVRKRDEPALEAAVELPVLTEAPLVNAIGVPLEVRPGVSDPASRPAPVLQGPEIDGPPCCMAREREPTPVPPSRRWLRNAEENAEIVIALLTVLLAIGFWMVWRRRPELVIEAIPLTYPVPDELPHPGTTPVPQLEPEVAAAMAKAREAQHRLKALEEELENYVSEES
ncbi:MAG TPA: hypothetical protein VF552_04020 [Allosphingosinicella sp.]|jgi:hypothetical protein